MSFKFDDSGLKKLQKNLTAAAKRVNGDISFDKLFTSTFMSKHTEFSSFSDLLDAGGYDVNTPEDFEAIPDDEFSEHIRKHTSFDSWDDMLSTAGEEYIFKEFKL